MAYNSQGYTNLEPATTLMECFRRSWLVSSIGIVLFFMGVNLIFWNEVIPSIAFNTKNIERIYSLNNYWIGTIGEAGNVAE